MYFGGFNPAILNQVSLNINDIDIIDIYTPLKSLYLSNRYEPVHQALSNENDLALKSSTIRNKKLKIKEDTIII